MLIRFKWKKVFLSKSDNTIIEKLKKFMTVKHLYNLKETSSLGNILDNSIQFVEGY